MQQKLPQEVITIIIDFLLTHEPETFSKLQQVSTQWKQCSNQKEPNWEALLALLPFGKKSAKQIFFQEPLYRYPQFFSSTLRNAMAQKWENFLSSLSKECNRSAEVTNATNNEILWEGIEIFIKRPSFKEETVHLLKLPNVILWRNLSLLDVFNEDLLSLFVEYHPQTIPFLLNSKEEKIFKHINDRLLCQIIEREPKFIPLILENPYSSIQGQILEYVKNFAEEKRASNTMVP